MNIAKYLGALPASISIARVVGGGLAIAQVSAFAASISYSSPTLGTPSGSWSQTATLPKFNPSLGTLTKVTISSSAEIQATIQVENFDAQPVVATAKETATVKVLRPGVQPAAGDYLVLTVSTAEQSVSLDAFDGNGGLVDIFGLPVAQFTGTDSAILGDPNNGGPLVGFNSISVDILPAEFAAFTGVLPYSPIDLDDQFTLTANASGSAVFTSSGNFGRRTTFSASAGITITYEYTPNDTSCVPKGTATIGYWKTHPEAWPVQNITVGCALYSKSDAIGRILSVAPRGDLRLILAQQLIAAKLSVDPSQCNQSFCITDDIAAADAILCKYPVGGATSIPKGLTTQVTGIQSRLDDYNNGRLCAPHRN